MWTHQEAFLQPDEPLTHWFISPCLLFKPPPGSSVMLFSLIKTCLWAKCKNPSQAAVHKIPWNLSSPVDLKTLAFTESFVYPTGCSQSNYNGSSGHFSPLFMVAWALETWSGVILTHASCSLGLLVPYGPEVSSPPSSHQTPSVFLPRRYKRVPQLKLGWRDAPRHDRTFTTGAWQ